MCGQAVILIKLRKTPLFDKNPIIIDTINSEKWRSTRARRSADNQLSILEEEETGIDPLDREIKRHSLHICHKNDKNILVYTDLGKEAFHAKYADHNKLDYILMCIVPLGFCAFVGIYLYYFREKILQEDWYP